MMIHPSQFLREKRRQVFRVFEHGAHRATVTAQNRNLDVFTAVELFT